jgi:hypothetical protein
MRLPTLLAIAPLPLLFALACEDEDPCESYVDYICSCHPEEDCEEQRNTYADADADLQDSCSSALDEKKTEDEESGFTCGEGDAGDDTGA